MYRGGENMFAKKIKRFYAVLLICVMIGTLLPVKWTFALDKELLKFEFSSPDDIISWTNGGSWEYSGRLDIGYDDVLKAMKVDLDYSNNANASWSEAKIACSFPSEQDLSGYNQASFDFIYDPAQMTKGSFAIKIVAGNKDAISSVELVNAQDYGNGLKKVTVVLEFKNDENRVSDLILGIVGQNTDYKGAVYIDNITFAYKEVEDMYVVATKSIIEQTPIAVNKDSIVANGITQKTPDKVKLVDDKAIKATAQLYAYLEAIGKTDSVLFGHQNDINHKAGSVSGGTESDVKDITGSIAAVYGVDSLSLTGADFDSISWETPLAERVAAVAEGTKKAVEQGAIVALTSHMPNFEIIAKRVENQKPGDHTSDTVGILEDGSYNFSGYSSPVLTGDIVTRIMPGQDLNKYYTAYLDMIAAYAKALEKDNISVLFRPFHENTGSWFWWGKAFCDAEAYKNLYRYTVEYLRDEKDVHNFIYVYGPGSEANSVEDYEERYPGDEYVDMVGFDMYHSQPAEGDLFIKNLKDQINIVGTFAKQHNKLFAVTETGVANGNLALLKTGNERKDWFNEVLEAVAPSEACYFLVWANWGEDGAFYTPYVTSKASNTIKGHEMLDYFIDFYNDGRSVFAKEMGDFSEIEVTVDSNDKVYGYFRSPVSGSYALDTMDVEASVFNIDDESNTDVKFVAKNKAGDLIQEVPAIKKSDNRYSAQLTKEQIAQLGETSGTLALVVNDEVISKINLKYNMQKPVVDPFVIGSFEDYYGEDLILRSVWNTGNGTGCTVEPSLSETNKYAGQYGLEFKYKLIAGGYAGVVKTIETDWSSKNALQLWILPDGKKQKVVIQVQSAGEAFEVYLNEYPEFNGSTEPMLVTIPFSSFAGRDNKNAIFDPSNIQSFGLWCNAILPEGADSQIFVLESVIYYDEIKAVTSDVAKVTFTPIN